MNLGNISQKSQKLYDGDSDHDHLSSVSSEVARRESGVNPSKLFQMKARLGTEEDLLR